VHGNETCGTAGILKVISLIESGSIKIERGSVTFVPITNPLAYNKRQRNGDRNLNRNLQPAASPQDYEDRIANVLCPLLAEHDALLDLHSFLSGVEPFIVIGPEDNSGELLPFSKAALEERFAMHIGVKRFVGRWIETYAEGVKERLKRTEGQDRKHLLSTDPSYGIGTTERMRLSGGYAITLECGQHEDPNSPLVAERAIRNALAVLGISNERAPAPTQTVELLDLVKVVDRHHADDQFAKVWQSFDRVKKGELIATRASGEAVLAPDDGALVFPNRNAPTGNEWFYFAVDSQRVLRSA
jgi:uncharacterized protein